MSRGNQTWIVLENGKRVAKQCRTEAYTVAYPIDVLLAVDKIAKKEKVTRLSILRMAVLEYVERNI